VFVICLYVLVGCFDVGLWLGRFLLFRGFYCFEIFGVLDFCVLFLCVSFLQAAHLIWLVACIIYRDVSHGMDYLL